MKEIKSFLIIDDNEEMLNTLIDLIQDWGYPIEIALSEKKSSQKLNLI